jgi:hypothetical protein
MRRFGMRTVQLFDDMAMDWLSRHAQQRADVHISGFVM